MRIHKSKLILNVQVDRKIKNCIEVLALYLSEGRVAVWTNLSLHGTVRSASIIKAFLPKRPFPVFFTVSSI